MQSNATFRSLEIPAKPSPRNLQVKTGRFYISDELKSGIANMPAPAPMGTFLPSMSIQNVVLAILAAFATPSTNVMFRGNIMTRTEKAKYEFLNSAVQIPGVSIKTYGGPTLGEQVIRVFVPDVLGAIADDVYALESRIRRQYRRVRLDLEIDESEDRNEQLIARLGAHE